MDENVPAKVLKEVRLRRFSSLKPKEWFIYFASDGQGYVMRKRDDHITAGSNYRINNLPPDTMVLPVLSSGVIPEIREGPW